VSPTQSIGTPALWAGFVTIILVLLALDLGVFHRSARRMTIRESVCWSAFWVSIAGLFNLAVFLVYGSEAGLAWTTGYLIEKSLSLDNVFVFTLVFATFKVPLRYQHRVLFWGIVGALVMRAVFVVLGASLLDRFHGLIYVFGLILLISGVKMLTQQAPTMARNSP
jgi:tellurite resistance protein TerC